MKTLIATLLIAVPLMAASHGAMAQSSTQSKAKATAAKKTVKKPVKKSTKAAAAVGGAAAVGAAAVAVHSEPLTAADMVVADRVFRGRIACELGAFVNVAADDKNPGYFFVDGKGFKYYMSPVQTTTGSIRLEDKGAGAVWLQVANKSMLMNQKAGQRLADECMSPEQLLVAEAIKKNPPPSWLDAHKP